MNRRAGILWGLLWGLLLLLPAPLLAKSPRVGLFVLQSEQLAPEQAQAWTQLFGAYLNEEAGVQLTLGLPPDLLDLKAYQAKTRCQADCLFLAAQEMQLDQAFELKLLPLGPGRWSLTAQWLNIPQKRLEHAQSLTHQGDLAQLDQSLRLLARRFQGALLAQDIRHRLRRWKRHQQEEEDQPHSPLLRAPGLGVFTSALGQTWLATWTRIHPLTSAQRTTYLWWESQPGQADPATGGEPIQNLRRGVFLVGLGRMGGQKAFYQDSWQSGFYLGPGLGLFEVRQSLSGQEQDSSAYVLPLFFEASLRLGWKALNLELSYVYNWQLWRWRQEDHASGWDWGQYRQATGSNLSLGQFQDLRQAAIQDFDSLKRPLGWWAGLSGVF